MPRRVYIYDAEMGWGWLNLLSSVGGFIWLSGWRSSILDIALLSALARKASPQPWNADTLEWATPMPVSGL